MSTYTPDQLDIIDIDVHNYVMGYVYRRDDRGVLRWHDRECKPLAATHTVPQYTRDWNAMGEVWHATLDLPSANRWVLVQRACGMPCAKFYWNDDRPDVITEGGTFPLAVALAALKARGVEVKL